jgi:hypothetical protein
MKKPEQYRRHSVKKIKNLRPNKLRVRGMIAKEIMPSAEIRASASPALHPAMLRSIESACSIIRVRSIARSLQIWVGPVEVAVKIEPGWVVY